MATEKRVFYDQIGEILYRKNPRAKNISIRISSHGSIRVTVPRNCTFKRAEKFVMNKSRWITDKSKKIEQDRKEKLEWKKDSLIPILDGHIRFMLNGSNRIGVETVENDFLITVPSGWDLTRESVQQALSEEVIDLGLKAGKQYLPQRLEEIAGQTGLLYRGVRVRHMISRWGSCSRDNRITLNSALVFLPHGLIDYVILHELIHTLHKNHGQAFWSALEHYLPDAKIRRKNLRNHPILSLKSH